MLPKSSFPAPKVFSESHRIRDYDLPIVISEFVFVLAAWFYFGRFVGWTEEFVRLLLFGCDFVGVGKDLFSAVR
jgi:hypothetical protein